MQTSYNRHPQTTATNQSYWWNTYMTEDTTVVIAVGDAYTSGATLPEDYEMNYTVTFSVYNATIEPEESLCQNDAGQASPDQPCVDAPEYVYGSIDALNITTMNQTFTGYVHDAWDRYDQYKVYMPCNYGMLVSVAFHEENNFDVGLYYLHPTYNNLYYIDASYNDNPEEVAALYSSLQSLSKSLLVREVIFISFLPALVRGLRVDLGRREVLVAQELLDRPHACLLYTSDAADE